jgi:predicted transcriptional regulator
MYVNIEAPSHNRCHSGKTINITYPECVSVALVIQHAMRMCRIILSSVVCPAVPYFSILSHKRHDSRGKQIFVYAMCVLTFSTNFAWRISHSKKEWPNYYHKCTVHRSSCKIPKILVRFSWNLNFLERFSNKIPTYKFHETRSVWKRVVLWWRMER